MKSEIIIYKSERDFGSKPVLKWAQAQMGTKRAKVGHLATGAI